MSRVTWRKRQIADMLPFPSIPSSDLVMECQKSRRERTRQSTVQAHTHRHTHTHTHKHTHTPHMNWMHVPTRMDYVSAVLKTTTLGLLVFICSLSLVATTSLVLQRQSTNESSARFGHFQETFDVLRSYCDDKDSRFLPLLQICDGAW